MTKSQATSASSESRSDLPVSPTGSEQPNGAASHHEPAVLSRAAGHVEDLTRRTLEKARQTSSQVREKLHRAGDATVGYIKEEPVKAVLIAAATGAATAVVLSWLARSRAARRSHIEH